LNPFFSLAVQYFVGVLNFLDPHLSSHHKTIREAQQDYAHLISFFALNDIPEAAQAQRSLL
jgi:hypothetical protein